MEINKLNSLLFQLVGVRLNAITFIEDYLELSFDGPKLQAMTPVRLIGEGFSFGPQQSGWRDGLCSLIGHTVASVMTGDDLEIHFSSGVAVAISLRTGDYRGPEAIVFTTGESDIPNTLIM